MSTTTAEEKSSGPLPFKHYQGAQFNFKPPQIAPSHYLGDLYTSTDPSAPITSGLYAFEAGQKLEYLYTYHEMKIILEGEVVISDETGQKVHARAGDSFYFPKGARITFESPSKGLAFFVGQRAQGAA